MHGGFQNRGAAVGCKEFGHEGVWRRLASVVENIFPRKTAINLAALAGLKERAAYTFLAGQSALSSDAVLSLLRSEHGKHVLDAVMKDSDADWYAEFSLLWDEAQLEAKRQELQRRREALREKP
jgi:hypothetical protein